MAIVVIVSELTSLTLTPLSVVAVIFSKSHTTKASKYVGILTVRLKSSYWNPSFMYVLIIGMFERAIILGSCARVTLKVAFNPGSSKHGKALRASVGWN